MPSYVRQRSSQSKIGPKKGLTIAKKVCFPKVLKKKAESGPLITNAPTDSLGIAFPSVTIAVEVLALSRIFAAVYSFITDCDETFNYWEPIHNLIYGHGLQTWEYSPAYALRSYASLWLFAGPSLMILDLFSVSPRTLFYILRGTLALITVTAEAIFYKAICREFGVHVGRLWLAFAVISSGSFISSAAMVPSAWCSAFSSAALAFWWLDKLPPSIFLTVFSSLIGWPFAGLISIPIAIDAVFRQRKFMQFLLWSMVSLVVILLPMTAVDSFYYGRLIVAPFNLIKYNVFTDHGPDLYGVEGWTFYFINGFLNFNIVWVFALMCPILLLVTDLFVSPHAKPRVLFCKPYWLSLMPLYCWLAVFMLQPHKEERFLFPVYPMICLCGAIAVDSSQKIMHRFMVLCKSGLSVFSDNSGQQVKERPKHYLAHTQFIMVSVIALSVLLGISRTASLTMNYSAPMDILKKLSNEKIDHTEKDQINVCYGKEWYRFPSSFHLPEGRFRIGFLKSEFSGMLPSYYSYEPNSTRIIHDHFNDMNMEDNRTYTDIKECLYLVDTDIGTVSPLQPDYASSERDWTILDKLPFLDAYRSHRLFRAFYMPFVSYKYTVYGNIYLLKSANSSINGKQQNSYRENLKYSPNPTHESQMEDVPKDTL